MTIIYLKLSNICCIIGVMRNDSLLLNSMLCLTNECYSNRSNRMCFRDLSFLFPFTSIFLKKWKYGDVYKRQNCILNALFYSSYCWNKELRLVLINFGLHPWWFMLTVKSCWIKVFQFVKGVYNFRAIGPVVHWDDIFLDVSATDRRRYSVVKVLKIKTQSINQGPIARILWSLLIISQFVIFPSGICYTSIDTPPKTQALFDLRMLLLFYSKSIPFFRFSYDEAI